MGDTANRIAALTTKIARVEAEITEISADCATLEAIESPDDDIVALCKRLAGKVTRLTARKNIYTKSKTDLETPPTMVDAPVAINNPAHAAIINKYVPQVEQ